MEYLKEFQAFAGRFSAAADERLHRIDGGTYNEFFRLYSRRWPTTVDSAVDDEQRQIDILIEELQQSIEAPELHSAPSGTVLHTGATEAEVGPALNYVCVALEKCLFFGAKGSAPDFWWIIKRAGRLNTWSADTKPDGTRSSGGVTDSPEHMIATSRKSDVGLAAAGGTAELVKDSSPEPLALTVSELTHVQTGHGRCRAWARALLGLDGADAQEELQRVSEAVIQEEERLVETYAMDYRKEGLRNMKGDVRAGSIQGSDSGVSSGINVKHADPDAGGGGSSITSNPRATSRDEKRDAITLSKDNLPLWLRPGPQGASILEDLCRIFRNFQTRLYEKGLSVRPSLDHAWLDHENIAASTTYTWPRFPREELRCTVRGAGLVNANGEYSPAYALGEDDVGDGSFKLTLVGPNDCQICRRDCLLGDELIESPAGHGTNLSQESGENAGHDKREKATMEEELKVAAIFGTTCPPTPEVWCLTVPVGPGQSRRIAYSCLGNGVLPPSRGWRAADVTLMPPPLLGFATHTNGESCSGGEDPTTEGGGGEASEGTFEPVVMSFTGNSPPVVTKRGWNVSGAAVAQTEACGDELVKLGSTGHPRRWRKRRRPPERSVVFDVDVAIATNGVTSNGKAFIPIEETRGKLSDSAFRLSDGAVAEAGEGFRAASPSSVEVDNLEEERQFMAERWTLPAPSGELLLRAERTRELLCRAAEKREMILAFRKRLLLDEVDAAQEEYQECMRESLSNTVRRILDSRPGLREDAEAEAAMAREARLEMRDEANNGRSELLVPSLEELVAEKAEELRMRPSPVPTEQDATLTASGGAGARAEHRNEASAAEAEITSPVVGEDVGWPWPVEWLNAPRVAPSDVGADGVKTGFEFDGLGTRREWVGSLNEKDCADAPPYSIEVAAVEVADMEDTETAHVEYVLRVVYREICRVDHPAAKPAGDPNATKLRYLSAAAKGLVQRTRLLSKRLNSLCALHPQLMFELEQGDGQLLSSGGSDSIDQLTFPDPFELGMLEESILRVYSDPLTPRFKANLPMRKLLGQVGSYLSSVLYFLRTLETRGHVDTRARMSRALNDALSICDRAGRKRRGGDFVLGVRIKDIAGGRLGYGRADDERLRRQKRRCMGCGRSIAAEFLGIKKDYFPCRYANGLFCRSICHTEDRRVIPHRVVHHWDFTPHRVCKDSAALLDATHNLPIINFSKESPRLFAEYQAFRLVRLRRKQLCSLREAILFPADRKCAEGARILEELLNGRMHLAEDAELYSMEDLIGVKKGSLLDLLEETAEALLAHVVDDCDVCESRAARVCEICFSSDLVFTFKLGTTARCPGCGSYFHAKCAEAKGAGKAGASGLKWWLDPTGVDVDFDCPVCKAAKLKAEVTE